MKPFTWNFSKLKNWKNCPRRHQHYDILKDIQEAPSLALTDGNRIHEAFKRRVELGLPMPTGYNHLSDWGDELLKIYHKEQRVYCEYQIAITRELKVCDWFAKDVWFRIKIDHLKLLPRHNGNLAALAIDFKTGKLIDELIQLGIYAQGIFSTWPNVDMVRTEYWWTKIKDKTVEFWTRDNMSQIWGQLLPELKEMENEYLNNNYPPKPSGLCKQYCGVTTCEYYKKGRQ